MDQAYRPAEALSASTLSVFSHVNDPFFNLDFKKLLLESKKKLTGVMKDQEKNISNLKKILKDENLF